LGSETENPVVTTIPGVRSPSRLLLLALLMVAVTAAPTPAFMCPSVIAQLAAAIAQRDPNDPKVKEARKLVEEAQWAHEVLRSHEESVFKSSQAARLLGIRF
jgi:aspartate/methionine/tyrosine aminotransferase